MKLKRIDKIAVTLPEQMHNFAPSLQHDGLVEWTTYDVVASVHGEHGLISVRSTEHALLAPWMYVLGWWGVLVHIVKINLKG